MTTMMMMMMMMMMMKMRPLLMMTVIQFNKMNFTLKLKLRLLNHKLHTCWCADIQTT